MELEAIHMTLDQIVANTQIAFNPNSDANRFLEVWHSLSPPFREELTRRVVESAQHDDARWIDPKAQNTKLMALVVEILDPWTEVTPRLRSLLDDAGVAIKSSVATIKEY